jgi:hypothetical protein
VAADGTVTDGLPPDRNPDKFGLTVFSVRDKASIRTDEEAGKSWDLAPQFRPPLALRALREILSCAIFDATGTLAAGLGGDTTGGEGGTGV